MKVYKVTGPTGLETTVQLSDDDAKARGLKSSDQVGEVDDVVQDVNTVGVSKAAVASNKQADPANKSVGGSK